MDDKELQLNCRGRKSVYVEKTPAYKKKFPDYVYDGELQWLEQDYPVPKLSEQIWHRERIPPKVGAAVYIRISCVMSWKVGSRKKIIFRPALSSLNWWECHPEEVEESYVLECMLLKIVESNGYEAWVKIRVISTLNFKEIPQSIEEKDEEKYIMDQLRFGQPYCWDAGNYLEVGTTEQGIINAWVFMKKNENEYRAILFGYSDWHQDFAYLINIAISKEEFTRYITEADL